MANKRKQLLEQLQSLEDKEVLWDILGEGLERKKGLIADLEKISLMEEISGVMVEGRG